MVDDSTMILLDKAARLVAPKPLLAVEYIGFERRNGSWELFYRAVTAEGTTSFCFGKGDLRGVCSG